MDKQFALSLLATLIADEAGVDVKDVTPEYVRRRAEERGFLLDPIERERIARERHQIAYKKLKNTIDLIP
jgi:hypothetical protein